MIRAASVIALMLSLPAHAEQRKPANDYPTAARADYVIGCMASSNFKREFLERCACGIDTIADTMTFEDYEMADTVLRMQQGVGAGRASVFTSTPVAREKVELLRRAQAEVTLQCR